MSHTFDETIDWNFSAYGKLWTYNLTYFDFLHQPDMEKEEGLRLMYDFMEKMDRIEDGLEPFPISLRGINWIKFLSLHGIEEKRIDDSLYAQYHILLDNLEYHLLGNHLLENGFSLLFGAYYFRDGTFYAKAKEILTDELQEQILEDGAHFELSPMYHQIMLYRLLDCIGLVRNNDEVFDDPAFSELLREKAVHMLRWLNAMTFEDGDIPLFNDSAHDIAPTTRELNEYAQRVGIEFAPTGSGYSLGESGYRKRESSWYEMVVDVGNIGPDYIPGHAHADTFGFELHVDGAPLIVDTGLSTYETGERRSLERSTAAHNTVEIEGEDQSLVWGGFRVAERAKVISLEEERDKVTAVHDGYRKRFGILHRRSFEWSEEKVVIEDTIVGGGDRKAVFRLHFHPDIQVDIVGNCIKTDKTEIILQNFIQDLTIKMYDYEYSYGFNRRVPAKAVEVEFNGKIRCEITHHEDTFHNRQLSSGGERAGDPHVRAL